MTPAELSATLGDCLARERDAIRGLDAEAVVRVSEEKEKILACVANAPEDERGPLLRALAEHKATLRRNLVLLAHTRDCIRDALQASGKVPGKRSLVSTKV